MQYIIAVLHEIKPRPGETVDQAAVRTQLEIVERDGTTLTSSRPFVSRSDVESDDEVMVSVGISPRRRTLLEVSDSELATIPIPLRRYRLLDQTIASRARLIGGVIEAEHGREAWEKAQDMGLTKIGLGRDYLIILDSEEGE